MCSPFARCRPYTLYQPVIAGVRINHPIQICELHDNEMWPCVAERQRRDDTATVGQEQP